jgi:predicted nuclease with TOPRIM domain
MHDLDKVYSRLQEKKAARRDIKSSISDELKQNAKYQEILDKISELKIEKKSIENELLGRSQTQSKLEELTLDIKTDTEMVTDIAVNMLLRNQTVEIVDDHGSKWVPSFSVRFKKG